MVVPYAFAQQPEPPEVPLRAGPTMPEDLPTVNLAGALTLPEVSGDRSAPVKQTATSPTQAEGSQAAENNYVGGQVPLEDPAALPVELYCDPAMMAPEDSLNAASAVSVGYDDGFVISSSDESDLDNSKFPFKLRINGWGQLRDTVLESKGPNPDLNQLQLKRGRINFSGNAFSPDIFYYVQLDGRSNSGDTVRILDYYLAYDVGKRLWNWPKHAFGFKTGLYKMPFSLARYISGKEFEFADRSMSSIYFDVNRSLAWSIYGQSTSLPRPVHWEAAVFNGLVTGGAETGSSGSLDNNNAFSARLYTYPTGEWGLGQLADLTGHDELALRSGVGVAFTTVDRTGSTEFNGLRVVDSGVQLSSLLPDAVNSYSVALYSIDSSLKYRGFSATAEYYFRNVNGFKGGDLPDLFDHGLWLQSGYFIVPGKWEALTRWSRVQGNSGTLGNAQRSSDELAIGIVRYLQQQHVKLTADLTFLDGAPINAPTLDILRGERGWLFRGQMQFSF